MHLYVQLSFLCDQSKMLSLYYTDCICRVSFSGKPYQMSSVCLQKPGDIQNLEYKKSGENFHLNDYKKSDSNYYWVPVTS